MAMKGINIMKHNFGLILLFLLVAGMGGANAQELTAMRNGDTVWLNGCALQNGIIVDDGGISNEYSNNFNGWVVIESDPGSTFSLSGSYTTESCCDRISVWLDDSLIIDQVGGDNTLSISGTGSRLTLYFRTDGSVVRDGFEMTWSVTGWGGSCTAQVSNLTASNITATGATLNWSSTGSGTYHVVVDNYEVGTTTSTTYTLTNLTPSSRHTVRVYLDGQESSPCCSDLTYLRTLCGSVTLPLIEGFDDYTDDDVMPNCWSRSFNFDGQDAEPQIVNLANFGTDNTLMVSCGTNDQSEHFGMVIGPVVLDRGTWRVRMRLRASHANTVALLGTCDTTSDEYASFGFTTNETYTFNDNNTWYEYDEIWTVPANGYRPAVRMEQSAQSGVGRRVYIDDIRIEACGIMTLSTNHVESEEMTVLWTTLGTPSVTVGVRQRGAIADEQTITNATSPLHITGLQPATNYIVTLYPTCGSVNGQPMSINVRTQNTGNNADRLCMGFFGSNSVPEDLNFINLNDIHVSGHNLHANSYNGSGYIVSGRLATVAGKQIAVRLHSYYSEVVIGTMTYADDPATFTPLDSTGGGWYWNQYLFVQVPTTNTDHYVALKIKNSDIDLHSIEMSNCEMDSLRVTHVRGTSITLQWAPLPAGNSNVTVEYGPQGFEMGSGTVLTTTNSSITIGGLTPVTTYEFIVYRPCGGTPCGNIRLRAETVTQDYPEPYCEDFENLSDNEWNRDWEREEGISNCPRIDDYHRWDGSRGLELAAYENSGSRVVLPDILLEDNSILSFWAYSSAPVSYIEIGHSESRRDENDYWDSKFTPFDTVELRSLAGWHHYAIPLPDSVRFRVSMRYFHLQNRSLYRAWVDNIQVSKAAFGNASFYNVGPTSVHVAAEALGTATALQLMLVDGGDTIYRTLTSDSTLVTGLDTATLYRGYLKPISTDAACWSYIGYFITPAHGSGGWTDCHDFEDVLSYELPNGWSFNNTDDSVWNMELTSLGTSLAGHTGTTHPTVATAMPYMGNASGNLTFSAKGLGEGSYLLVGAPVQITVGVPNIISSYQFDSIPDTLWLDTANWTSFILPIDEFPEWGHYILFEVGGNGGAMLDNIGISSCPIVNFSYEDGGLVCTTQSGYDAEYFLNLDDGDSVRTFHVLESPFILTDIALGHTYTISWQCPYQNSGCLPKFIFSTPNLLPLPYCNDFDADGDNIPSNWRFVNPTTSSYVEYYYWNTSLYLHNYSNRWQYAILPDLVLDSSLSIKINISSSSEGSFELGYLSNPNDTGSFVTIARNPYLGGSWWTMEVDLYNYRGKRLAMRTNDYVYIDYIYLVNSPRVHYSHIDARTVKVWTEHGGEYWLHYSSWNTTCEFPENTIHVTDSVLFFRDTCHNWNWCSDLYFYQMPDSANTACDRERSYRLSYKYDIPYCHDFSNDYSGYSNGSWGLSSCEWQCNCKYGQSNADIFKNNDMTALRMNCGQTQLVILPEMNIDSMRNASLVLEYLSTTPNSSIMVGILTDAYDSNTFVPIDTINFFNAYEWNSVLINFNNYTDTGRWIGLRTIERQDGSWFYIKEIRVESCHSALGATASLYRHNVVKIDNPLPSADDDFFVEYGLHNFPQGTGTIMRISERPVYLTLQNETDYDFYFRCDSAAIACAPVQVVTTLCAPIPVPACIDFDTNALNAPPHCWTTRSTDIKVDNTIAHSGTQSLSFATTRKRPIIATPDIDIDSLQKVTISLWVYAETQGDRLVVGTMADPHDNATFHPIRTLIPTHAGQWERFLVDFSSAAEDAHFIGLRATGSVSTSHVYVDDLFVTDCGAHGLRAVAVSGDSISLDWSQVGSPNITIEMTDNGMPSRTFTHVSSHPFTVFGLTPKHRYTFHFTSTCNDNGEYCTADYEDSTSLVTPSEGVGCINPTDLSSPQAVFFSGTFGNPYTSSGAIDYGSNSPDSRHTVHYDTAERDPRTGGLLRTVPEGFSSSVRLGNWNTNENRPEAEGVIYSLFVDTASFDMLVMRYAAVLQNPMHASADQPRFRLELLDSNMNLINPNCAAADFIADRNLGWNEADDNVLWKDWTAVGIDLSAYAEQNIFVRLTTFDCNEGSHYGYAYFTLDCMRRQLTTDQCGDVESNTFTAPIGFNYRWYTSASSATYSTAQSITVPTENITYYCQMSFVDNPSCNFTISAYAGTRYPLARMTYTTDFHDCAMYVNFENTSAVSSDGVNPLPGNEKCERAYWDFGNGQTSNSYHGSTVYYESGDYTITLIVSLADGECLDTLVQTISLFVPSGRSFVSANECDSYTWRGHTYTRSGNYTDTLPVTNMYGCDSTITLQLTIRPSIVTNVVESIVQNQLPYRFNGTDYNFNNLPVNGISVDTTASVTLSNVLNCDSIVNLYLHVWLNRDTALTFTSCRNKLPVQWRTAYLETDNSSAIYNFTIPTTHAADSNVTITLNVLENPTISFYDTVIENQLPYRYRNSRFYHAVDTALAYPQPAGCDSVVMFHLHVWRNSQTTHHRIVCDSQLPYTWCGVSFTHSDTVTVTIPSVHGADSVVTLEVEVMPTYETYDTLVVCPGYPYLYEGVDYGGPTSFTSLLTTPYGCDSIAHVTIMDRSSSFRVGLNYSFDSVDWHDDPIIFGCSPAKLHLRDTTPGGYTWRWVLDTPDTAVSSQMQTMDYEYPYSYDSSASNLMLIVGSDYGCFDTVYRLVYIFSSPVAEFEWEPNMPAMHDPQVQFYNNTYPLPDTTTYLWEVQSSVGGEFDTSSAVAPHYRWGQQGDDMTGEYTVNLIAYWLHEIEHVSHTCTDTATHVIVITNDDLTFPNLVTPNGDGINDTWIIGNLLEYSNYSMNELWIYNQWGVLVYHVKDIRREEQFWDPNDGNCPNGTYYYRFSAMGDYGLVKRNGIIEVLRGE